MKSVGELKLKFNNIYKLYLLKFLHFCIYTRRDIFNSIFSYLLPEHDYPTRNIWIRLPFVSLLSFYTQFCILYFSRTHCFCLWLHENIFGVLKYILWFNILVVTAPCIFTIYRFALSCYCAVSLMFISGLLSTSLLFYY